MIKKYKFGNPINTDSVIIDIEISNNKEIEKYILDDKFVFKLDKYSRVYGLGGSNRGINKIGFEYVSYATDDPVHTPGKKSLYACQNFLILKNSDGLLGMYFDYPSLIKFDIGNNEIDKMIITPNSMNLYLYLIKGDNYLDIVKKFKEIIGRSYIPPRWAFGYGQSKWGYMNQDDILEVYRNHEKYDIPLDMIYLDIDYMERFKDFTINEERFPEFEKFVKKMSDNDIKLIPIIDAGVKIESNYDLYEEGIKNNYFCKFENGEDFKAAVWPGLCHFPDFLNKDARKWFGDKYSFLVEKGIKGFWNDMNEPSLFYTKRGLENMNKTISKYALKDNLGISEVWECKNSFTEMDNNILDYKSFYHNIDDVMVNHNEVHNLYGYNMTRSAMESLNNMYPSKRFLLFSRSSYIGMHRYGGIWTGDNHSWPDHIKMSLEQMPGYNMCGFNYVGSDIGGFSGDTNETLMYRWLQFSIFTPLMRNHSALGTRMQEIYQFKDINYLKSLIELRYRLLPYIYSEYMKATIRNEMYFKPLAFFYPDDEIAENITDQLIIGNEIMIAPIYEQDAKGKLVYIPERMKCYIFNDANNYTQHIYEKGSYFIKLEVNQFCIFLRENKAIPFSNIAKRVKDVDFVNFDYLSFGNSTYEYYYDDGETMDIKEENILKKNI